VGPGVIMAQASINFNPILCRGLAKNINLTYGNSFLSDGSKPNMSVLTTILSRPGHFYRTWRGQVAAYGMKDNELDGMRCKDMDMKDFRHLVDHFLTGSYNSSWIVGTFKTQEWFKASKSTVSRIRNCSTGRNLRLSTSPSQTKSSHLMERHRISQSVLGCQYIHGVSHQILNGARAITGSLPEDNHARITSLLHVCIFAAI
jgi:hypothetical protein